MLAKRRSFTRVVSLAALVAKSLALSPPVTVSLRSSWPAPPFLLELIETFALENPNSFFPILDALINPENVPALKTLTPEAVRQSAFQIVNTRGLLSEPGALASVDLNLALHSATPKIEAFYEYYADRMDEQRKKAEQDDKCGSWVDWYGEVICDLDTLVRLTGWEFIDSGVTPEPTTLPARPKILSFDHIHPSPLNTLEPPPETAIFYASLDSPNFWEIHNYLYKRSSRSVPQVEYILRPIPGRSRNIDLRNYLSGYGVGLDLKNMEYLALDDRHSSGAGAEKAEEMEKEQGGGGQALDSISVLFEKYPVNETAEESNSPLNPEEISETGLKSTQLISDSPHPLRTLSRLAQNFPKYVTKVARRVVVKQELLAELGANQRIVPGGTNMVWLNGVVVGEGDMNPFSLLRLLRKERGLMTSLTSLGLSRAEAIELLTHPAIGASQKESVTDGLFDSSDRIEGGGVIEWWNDFEKDKRYAKWTPSIGILLSHPANGQFHTIKRNMFSVILVLDLSQTANLQFVGGPLSMLIERGFPFRWGVVGATDNENAAKMARLFRHLIDNYGRAKTMKFIKDIARMGYPPQMLPPHVDLDFVRSNFEQLVSSEPPKNENASTDFDQIINNMEFDDSKVRAYQKRLSAEVKEGSQGHAFFNGKHFEMDENLLRYLQSEVGLHIRHLQEKLYAGELSDADSDTIDTHFFDLPTTAKSRNRYIYPNKSEGGLKVVNLMEVLGRAGFGTGASTFVYPASVGSTGQVPLSVYVIGDFDTEEGLELVKEAVESMDANSPARVSFIHNPSESSLTSLPEAQKSSRLVAQLVSSGALAKANPSRILKTLGLQSEAVAGESTADGKQTVMKDESAFEELVAGKLNEDTYVRFVKACRLVVRELKINGGEQAVIVNGRIVGPFGRGALAAGDFRVLREYEFNKRTSAIVSALEAVRGAESTLDKASQAHLVSMLQSVTSAIQLPDPSEVGLNDAPSRPRTRNYQTLSDEHASFEVGNNSTAMYHFGVILDPVGEMAQKWPSLLEWLSEVPDVYIRVYLNPSAPTQVPLKRFYRYNLLPFLTFDENGQEVPAQAVFGALPIEPVYTLGMEVPPAWLVRPREAQYDLDNIQLGKLASEDSTRGVEAVFELDYLVVEGHARDTFTGSPPRGLQLQLTTSNSSPIDDTQVVANLGYLQFKAKPGVFQLEIREGVGRTVFRMESVGNEGWDSPGVDKVGNEITVTSFDGLTLYPRLARLPGMEGADVLAETSLVEDEEEEENFVKGMFSKVSAFFKPKEEPKNELVTKSSGQADINIFTVASGILYERFVSIMILSVLRNTNSTVKFWFIENFLSPSFLEFIPHLAEAYKFDYELVTYKWPSWLRAQKEKQRIIWAYKILFLDVLFPMDLKKVIFVDADQIVRADLKELVDLDLHGAPYGYTPMGDDNVEMEGYRFWKTGYWKDFLQGRPYHISALYVVDLVRFRQVAAGDLLRGQYQHLSQDPNSLANLDQDLPNNLQREVPIFSLPEDWLWCETWCSKDRLDRAKTIDLCQNPMTKEPKLSRARQIPEWEEYDSEISRFARQLAKDGKIQSGMAAAGADALANAGSPTQQSPPEDDGDTGSTEPSGRERDEL